MMKTIVMINQMRQIVSCGIAQNRNSSVMMAGAFAAANNATESLTVVIRVMKRIALFNALKINLNVLIRICVLISKCFFLI